MTPRTTSSDVTGRNPDFVVTPPAADESLDDGAVYPAAGKSAGPAQGGGPSASSASPPPSDADEVGTSRITLRLAESLKSRAEAAAGQVGLSVNAWLVRAVAAALEPDDRDRGSGRHGSRGGQRYTGWVR